MNSIQFFISNRVKLLVSICAFSLIIISCESTPVPRPKGYLRYEFPAAKYEAHHSQSVPFVFEKSVFSTLHYIKSHWINIDYHLFDANLHLTYTPLHNNYDAVLREVQKTVYDHTIKADGITERPFVQPVHGVYGTLYDLDGETATNIQFYVSDSTRHMISGSLYFYSSPNPDSLAPMINYVREDIIHLIETLRWVE